MASRPFNPPRATKPIHDPWLKRFLFGQLGITPADNTRTPQAPAARTVSARSPFRQGLPLPELEAPRAPGAPRRNAAKDLKTVASFIPGVQAGIDAGSGRPVQGLAELGLDLATAGGGAAAAKAALRRPAQQLAERAAASAIPGAADRFAILTAENAGGRSMSAAENEARNAALLSELRQRGHEPIPVKGRYKDPTTGEVLQENSFHIPGMSEREAKLVAKRYGQNGVITQAGYHDLAGNKFFPATGAAAAASDLPYTELPNGQRFALPIDWENGATPKVNALPIPKNANPEAMRLVDELRQSMGAGAPAELPRVKKVDPAKAQMMARVYDKLPANDPAAKRAYDALNKEVSHQLKAINDAGYKIEYVDSDPYKNSQELFADLRDNRRMKVLKTNEGSQHPYMTREQNDAFRAVHDFIAHGGGGNQFGPVGEENAYRIHASTLSPTAQRALATETRGQNSWVNFGPNAHLPVTERPFATQKAALFPESLLGDYSTMPNEAVVNAQQYLEQQGNAQRAAYREQLQGPRKAAEARVAAQRSTPFPQIPGIVGDSVAARGVKKGMDLEAAARKHIADIDHIQKTGLTPSGQPVSAGRLQQLSQERASAREYLNSLKVAGDSVAARGAKRAAKAKPVEAPAVVLPPNSGNVFDTSKLGAELPAGVVTARPPLNRPKKADLSYLNSTVERVAKVFTPNAKKALKETPEMAGWYDWTQIQNAMADLTPTGEKDFNLFARLMGPTSIGTNVPANIRQASNFFYLLKNGQLGLDDLEKGTVNMAPGYANRRQKSVNAGVAKILKTGDLDPLTTPKTFRYSNQLGGKYWGGTALDMHVGRQIGPEGVMPASNAETNAGQKAAKSVPFGGRGFPAPSYPQTNLVESSPANTAYAHIEDAMVNEANKMGLAPAQYQALGWAGGGPQTGVFDTRSALELFNERLRATAEKYGYASPLDAFHAFAKGETPLWGMAGAGLGIGAYNREQPRY